MKSLLMLLTAALMAVAVNSQRDWRGNRRRQDNNQNNREPNWIRYRWQKEMSGSSVNEFFFKRINQDVVVLTTRGGWGGSTTVRYAPATASSWRSSLKMFIFPDSSTCLVADVEESSIAEIEREARLRNGTTVAGSSSYNSRILRATRRNCEDELYYRMCGTRTPFDTELLYRESSRQAEERKTVSTFNGQVTVFYPRGIPATCVYSRERGNSRDSVRGNSRDSVRGNSRESVRGNSHDSVRGNSRDSVRGNSRVSVRGNSRDSVRGNSRDSVRGWSN